MSGVGDLLVGLAALVGSLASAIVLVWTTIRQGRKPGQLAKSAAEETAAALAVALADGELSEQELDAIHRALQRRRGGVP